MDQATEFPAQRAAPAGQIPSSLVQLADSLTDPTSTRLRRITLACIAREELHGSAVVRPGVGEVLSSLLLDLSRGVPDTASYAGRIRSLSGGS